MEKMRIVVMDGHAANPGDLSWEAFEEFGEVVVYERTSAAEVVERAKDADCVFTNKVVFNEENISRLPKLKYIGILATGTNVVDINAANAHGVVVTNVPTYSTDSVAQLVFSHILNVITQVDKYASDNRQGRWSRNRDFTFWDRQVHELSALRIGIIGLGSIGAKVAQIANAFGMKIYAYTSKPVHSLPECVKKSTLDGLFNNCDVISLHCPLTPETEGLINKETLAKMKSNAILVNTGRGPLVNEKDVAEALNEGVIAAYCADVMCQEPPAEDNPLFKCENAYITPHFAWATIEARQRLLAVEVENLRAFIEGKPINVVR